MSWVDKIRIQPPAIRFCLLFALVLGGLVLVFEQWQVPFGWVYMYPVAVTATFVLNLLTIPAELNTAHLPQGYCELGFTEIVYRVTFDCTGLFALFVFLALTAAYPTSGPKKGSALLLGVPAIFVFGSLRMVSLGVVAHLNADWIELFHVYVMELATLGFMLYVWKYWINEIVHAEKRPVVE